MSGLLLLTPAARAGTYAVTYSGGTYSSMGGYSGTTSGSYTGPSAYGGAVMDDAIAPGQPNPSPATAKCIGGITATFTWQPAYTGEPTPSCVIVEQQCAASCPYGEDNVGTVNDGLGDSKSVNDPGQTGGSVGVSGTTYTPYQSPAAVFSVQCSPSATAYSVYGVVWPQVSYIATPFIPTINLVGTTPDASGNQNILVGQGCMSSMSGLPGFATAAGNTTSYFWSASNTTFSVWSPTTPPIGTAPANPNASYYVGGLGKINFPTAHWYWNNLNNGTETVTGYVTLKPPTGQGNPFMVTIKRKVNVQVPSWAASGASGYVQVNDINPKANGAFSLYAGPSPVQQGGMVWTANSTVPSLFGGAIAKLELVQIITPYDGYNTSLVPGLTHPDPNNGLTGLDSLYPYGWLTVQTGFAGGFTPYMTNDSPTLMLNNNKVSATLQDSFIDYLMFQPPGSDVQWVPLGLFNWSTNGNATIPPSGNWADFVATYGSDTAGTISPTSGAPFTAGNTFPAWIRIDTPQPF